MVEILQFYVSGFWIWLGLTIGLYIATLPLLVFAGGLLGVAVNVSGVTVSKKEGQGE